MTPVIDNLSRRHAIVRALTAGTLTLGPCGPARAESAQDLLAASDAIRNPGQSFRVLITLNEFERGQLIETSVLSSLARTDGSGQFSSLLRFVQPARDVGKLMLKTGQDLWFYDPSSKASVRLSPQQRLLGQASNGDVLTVNFAKDYRATLAGEEQITDGEKRKRQTLKLALTASEGDAAYATAELWIDAQSRAPVKARFYAESGRLLKTAFYRKYQQQLGAERPTETVIIDGLNPQSVTLIQLSEFQSRQVPASWMQRDHLPRHQADQ